MSADTNSTPLMTALNFTADDLSLNRDGRLSPSQVDRLRRNRRRTALVGAAILLGVVLTATTALFLGQVNRTPVLTFIGIAITVCGALAGGITVRNWYRLSSDIDQGAIQTLDGVVQHTVRVAGRAATYVLKVGAQELIVAKPVFLALRNGGHYRFYRTPTARVLLSAEAA